MAEEWYSWSLWRNESIVNRLILNNAYCSRAHLCRWRRRIWNQAHRTCLVPFVASWPAPDSCRRDSPWCHSWDCCCSCKRNTRPWGSLSNCCTRGPRTDTCCLCSRWRVLWPGRGCTLPVLATPPPDPPWSGSTASLGSSRSDRCIQADPFRCWGRSPGGRTAASSRSPEDLVRSIFNFNHSEMSLLMEFQGLKFSLMRYLGDLAGESKCPCRRCEWRRRVGHRCSRGARGWAYPGKRARPDPDPLYVRCCRSTFHPRNQLCGHPNCDRSGARHQDSGCSYSVSKVNIIWTNCFFIWFNREDNSVMILLKSKLDVIGMKKKWSL